MTDPGTFASVFLFTLAAAVGLAWLFYPKLVRAWDYWRRR